MSVLIRKARVKDLPAIVELSVALNEYHKKFKNRDYYGLAPGAEQKFRKHRRAQIYSKNSAIFVAELSGSIIGFASGSVKRSRPVNRVKLYGQLDSGFVKEKYRRMGIGKKLAESVLGWVKTKGVRYIVVDTNVSNVPGLRTVKKLGFKELEYKLIKNL